MDIFFAAAPVHVTSSGLQRERGAVRSVLPALDLLHKAGLSPSGLFSLPIWRTLVEPHGGCALCSTLRYSQYSTSKPYETRPVWLIPLREEALLWLIPFLYLLYPGLG